MCAIILYALSAIHRRVWGRSLSLKIEKTLEEHIIVSVLCKCDINRSNRAVCVGEVRHVHYLI